MTLPGELSSYKPGPVVHYLVFRGKDEEDGYDFDVKHEPDRCPEIEWFWGRDYYCDVAVELVDAGHYAFGCFDNALDHLAPGTYVLRHWVEKHPATPSHGEEWSSGLEVGDRVA